MLHRNELIGLFILQCFWGNNAKLLLENNSLTKEVTLVRSYEEYCKTVYFYKRIFKASPKHDPKHGWGSPFPWDSVIGQELLESAIDAPGNSQALYNYYAKDDSFVIFRIENQNVYHGYNNWRRSGTWNNHKTIKKIDILYFVYTKNDKRLNLFFQPAKAAELFLIIL